MIQNVSWAEWPQEIVAALVAAQKEVSKLKKTDRNDFANYDYVSAETVLGEAKQAMEKHGLIHLSWVVDIVGSEGKEDIIVSHGLLHESGKQAWFATRAPLVVGKGKPRDKAACTADTTDMSYTLLRLLGIVRVDKSMDLNTRNDNDYDPDEKKLDERLDGARGLFGEEAFAEIVGEPKTVKEKQEAIRKLSEEHRKRRKNGKDKVLSVLKEGA